MILKLYSKKNRLFIKTNGNKQISGKTLESDADSFIPYHRVFLFDQKSKEYIGDVFSDEKGEYAFRGIGEGPFFIVSHYVDDSKNGEMADNIVPQRDPIYDQIID